MIVDKIVTVVLCVIFLWICNVINAMKTKKFDGEYIVSLMLSLLTANTAFVGVGFLDKGAGLNYLNPNSYESWFYNVMIGILLILLSIYFLKQLSTNGKNSD